MIIGVPKEIKDAEYRVGATPAMVRALVEAGHQVSVQAHAGKAVGFPDEQYERAGAKILETAEEIYSGSEMIIKVKEPQESEFSLLREGQILFGYLHLAPDPQQTQHLLERKIVGIAYETVTDGNGRLPLLQPMSEIAGRISIQVGAYSLHMVNGGRGALLGGVPGVAPGKVVIVGGGVAGAEAARMAMGLGADVIVLDTSLPRLRELDMAFGPRLKTVYSSAAALEEHVLDADLVVGSVLIPGKTTPKLISRDVVRSMHNGAVIVDISIDQGGCAETSRPTSHGDPLFVVDGVVHYCVSNIPAACARTATLALTNATMQYALTIAGSGYREALRDNRGLRQGLNVWHGKVTNEAVANDLGYDYSSPDSVLT